MERSVNRFRTSLDTLIRPEVHLRGRVWPSFQVFCAIGLVLAISLTMALVMRLGLSPWVMAPVIVAAVATLFGLAMATKVVTGEERLTQYHHMIAVMGAAAGLVSLMRQPMLAYLDVTMLGVGMFAVVGRIGCLMAGCCHGRPYRWGVCYGQEHAANGFTPYYVGIRLFPIQAVESLWILGLVLVGSALLLSGEPPGTTLAWYLIGYATGRFYFEFMRGDAGRPYRWGFSEAQWTSIFLVGSVVLAEWAALLPWYPWPAAVTACLAGTMLAVAAARRFQSRSQYQILLPDHVREVAEAIEIASHRAREIGALDGQDSIPVDIRVAATSLGFQISAGLIWTATGSVFHYALSCRNETMSAATARTLAALILQLKHPLGPSELVEGDRGVFHLLSMGAEA